MKLSPKQRVYLEILELILPLFRNAELLRDSGKDIGSYTLEADFVHNLPARLMDPNFCEEDLRWLNIDARSYVEGGAGQKRQLYGRLCARIAELMSLVPEEMKPRLEWEGPSSRDEDTGERAKT